MGLEEGYRQEVGQKCVAPEGKNSDDSKRGRGKSVEVTRDGPHQAFGSLHGTS